MPSYGTFAQRAVRALASGIHGSWAPGVQYPIDDQGKSARLPY